MSENHTNNWRQTKSSEAYSLILKHHADFGLVRIANITNLDYLNIPVYIGLRPRGKTLCVSAGKGLNHIDSIVSAGMESIEIDVAERVDQTEYFHSSYSQLSESVQIPFDLIPSYKSSQFSANTVATWMKLYGLNTGTSFYYPACLITLDKTYLSEPLNTFPWSSNGLASGLTTSDAILSALYEVIERDAWSCWESYNRKHCIPFSAVLEDSIPFESTKNLISKIKDATLDVVINPLATDIGIPVYRCLLLNPSDQAGAISLGFGCHHIDEIAINRAITEAVQARAVYISGARDDIVVNSIMSSANLDVEAFKSLFIPAVFNGSNFSQLDTESAIKNILSLFHSLGMHEPLVYEFLNAAPFSVVRIVAPSLAPSGARKGLPISKHPRFSSFQPKLTGLAALFSS